jgi:Holliday junction DNA helicase RuvA
MIGKISGRLDWKGQGEVLIDCRGVGYIVMSTTAPWPRCRRWARRWPCTPICWCARICCSCSAFPPCWTRNGTLLTTVQGGAKAAMAILGTLGAEGVARAITLGDARAVQAAPGVGPKLAQRVILELKAKAPSVMAMGARLQDAALVIEPVEPPAGPAARRSGGKTAPPPAAPSAAQMRAGYAADALSALMNLGYGQGDAAEAVAIAGGEAPEADTAALILLALKRLAPR